MKIMHEQIGFSGQPTLKIKWGEIPFFGFPWHYHSEYEILYVLESYGTRFVADSVEPFEAGELVMLGRNLPHYWRNDEKYYKGDPRLVVKRLTIHVPGELFGDYFIHLPEFLSIKKMLERSERGIRFLPPFDREVGALLTELPEFTGFNQLIRFLEILQLMSEVPDFKLLASEAYKPGLHDLSDDRVQKVIRFLTFNYQHHISLGEVASLAGMHPTAFCRFFKEKTGKLFSQYLNELRVGFACKLLMDGNLQISQICFETGFNNLSNFNRTFKTITGLTPTSYQLQFRISRQQPAGQLPE